LVGVAAKAKGFRRHCLFSVILRARLRRAGLPAGRQGLKPACREAGIPSTTMIADYC